MSLNNLSFKIHYEAERRDDIFKKIISPAGSEASLVQKYICYLTPSLLAEFMEVASVLSSSHGRMEIITGVSNSLSAANNSFLQSLCAENALREFFIDDFLRAIEPFSDSDLLKLKKLCLSETLSFRIITPYDRYSEYILYSNLSTIFLDDSDHTFLLYGQSDPVESGTCPAFNQLWTFCSWKPGQNEYCNAAEKEFCSIWNNEKINISSFNFLKDISYLLNSEVSERGLTANTEAILRDYQKEAIQAWVNNGYKGFYVMATGTGKTWTAIYAALRLYAEHKHLMVICAPYKHLIKQWQNDIQKIIPQATTILVSSENLNWEKEISEAIVKQRFKPDTQIVIISTIISFNLPRFESALSKSRQEKLLIVDEAHRFTKRSDKILSTYKYLLGLSATPFNGKEAQSGQNLMNYFGGQVYDLPIEAALEKRYLVPYNYYPIFVHATAEEEDDFRKNTFKMISCFRNGKCIDPENFNKAYRARLRVLALAEEKILKMDEFLAKVKERDHLIVYCGDGKVLSSSGEEQRHIDYAKEALYKAGYIQSQFTAAEKMQERMDLIEAFDHGIFTALAAIRCLDEGVNIPSIKGALLLASNDSFREFTQRRGRILRLYEDKEYANIYDVIVLPSLSENNMAAIELRRFKEYARLATNSEECLAQLEKLKNEYCLSDEEISFTFDMFEEEFEDD